MSWSPYETVRHPVAKAKLLEDFSPTFLASVVVAVVVDCVGKKAYAVGALSTNTSTTVCVLCAIAVVVEVTVKWVHCT